MRSNDLNSKVDNLTFNNIIDDIEEELETLADKTIPSGGSEGQILKWSQDGSATWSNPSLLSVAFSSENGDITLPDSDNIKSEDFPGGGSINVRY